MANAKELKDRIRSVGDTRKITNAMYLIASMKMRKAKAELDGTRPYFEAIRGEIKRIFRTVQDVQSQYFYPDSGEPPLHGPYACLVITADKGMCGSYNHNIIKLTEQKIGTGQHNSLYVMGQIGRMYFQRKARAGELDVDPEFMYTPQNPTMYRARHIAEQILKEFDDGKLDDVYIIYTKMVTSITFEPKILQLLPLDAAHFVTQEDEITRHHEASFLPSPRVVMEHLTPNFMKGLIYGAMVESFCSEQQARMSAMDSATTSAKDMLQTLSLQYNRARQAAITQEITEVVSGSNAAGL